MDERVYLLGRFCKYMINMIRPGALATFLHKDGSDNSIIDLLLVQRYLRSNNRDASDQSLMRLDRMMTGVGCRSLSEKNMFLLSSQRTGPQMLTIYSLPPATSGCAQAATPPSRRLAAASERRTVASLPAPHLSAEPC